MSSGKKLFILGTILFLMVIGYFVWDMSQQTTKPWGKPKIQKKEIF
jgi:antibiotic biosynthesis monooxygenase (ABM) superfamily enzyme